MSRACTGLGVYPAGKEVQAKLHKRLLYEKDARFKPIRKKTVDNIRPVQAANLPFIWEKCPGKFETLVIVLPSRHRKRGPSSSCWQIQGIPCIQVLRVRDDLCGVVGPHVRFGYSSAQCPFNRFSGVYHEVKPVLSGHWLVLTYNLIHASFSPQAIRLAPTDTVLSG
jgi:hypothetical protein